MEVKVLQVELKELKCSNCGSVIKYHPGQQSAVCPHCGTVNKIEYTEAEYRAAWQENDYLKYLEQIGQENLQPQPLTIQCPACGAKIETDTRVISTTCPYCGTSIVLEPEQIQRKIKPQGIVPFKIGIKEAKKQFVDWARSRWFAPNKFRKYITAPSRFHALYVPYWTFDADTVTDYVGERGDYYYVTVTYTDSSGNTQTRQERRIRWTPVSGSVRVVFDDILVNGKIDNQLPRKITDWNLAELKPYDTKLLSGFEAEAYTVSLKQAFEIAKQKMKYEIERAIRRDIGGDEQRIIRYSTTYYDVTFKHILLPVYISSYKYKDKVYNFVINGQTGKVYGKYPISPWKVALVVLLVLLIIGLIVLFAEFDGDVNAMWHSLFGWITGPAAWLMVKITPKFQSMMSFATFVA